MSRSKFEYLRNNEVDQTVLKDKIGNLGAIPPGGTRNSQLDSGQHEYYEVETHRVNERHGKDGVSGVCDKASMSRNPRGV